MTGVQTCALPISCIGDEHIEAPECFEGFGHHVFLGVKIADIGGDADERNAQYRMYQDLDEGSYLNNFSLLLKKSDGAFVNVTGGGAGRHRPRT